MRLMVHSLKKDLRRLWPAMAVTWVILGALTRADRWRGDWMASSMEGWLNLLLTMAWALLAALAVLEEPLVGEHHFWNTRPLRWHELLLAKLGFVVAVIHLPSLMADIFVLGARGFWPGAYLGVLLWKQFLVFAAVSLPAMALASLVRSFTHFVIVMFAIAAGIAILNGGFQSMPNFQLPDVGVRTAAIRILLAAMAVVVIWTQYARRRVIPARVMAVAAMLAAASISAWLPARAEYAVANRASEDLPRVSMRTPSADESHPIAPRPGGTQVATLPIAIEPGTPDQLWRIRLVDVEIVAADGTRLRSTTPSRDRPFEKIDLVASTGVSPIRLARSSAGDPYGRPDSLVLRFSAPAWERFKNARVRVRGTVAFDFYRRGATAMLPLERTVDVPGFGRCSSIEVDDPYSEKMLKVFCESPREVPAAALTLRHDPSGREWKNYRLSTSVGYLPGPRETWLSPLHRGQVYFRLTDFPDSRPAYSNWEVPTSYLPSAHIEMVPEVVTGHGLASFDFGEMTLSSWLAALPGATVR